jgi:hypothetical protein
MPAEIASETARYKQGKDHHRQGVRGIAEKKHKLLDERHLDQNITGSDAGEVQQEAHDSSRARQTRAQR